MKRTVLSIHVCEAGLKSSVPRILLHRTTTDCIDKSAAQLLERCCGKSRCRLAVSASCDRHGNCYDRVVLLAVALRCSGGRGWCCDRRRIGASFCRGRCWCCGRWRIGATLYNRCRDTGDRKAVRGLGRLSVGTTVEVPARGRSRCRGWLAGDLTARARAGARVRT